MNDASIDVVVRTGGRPAILLARAVSSLARQTAGAIRLLLVRHGPADTGALQALVGGALRDIEVIDAPGANRARAMAAGLAHVTAPRFALLDDDDYLLEDHFLHLLHAAESVAAPAFAYCDILALDEAAAPGTGLRSFREGPARPPLGRITDRISVHAFLADRTALQGLPFDRWGMATAEDALLVAWLLARSTPVHTPHATCVYVQGRGDASAYLAHPDRAADELTFAREVAPVRAVIEAKFGTAEVMDEATYLAPFIAAARHAALFAELKTRPSGSGLVAVREVALTTPAAEDPALATTEAPLEFEAVAGAVRTSDEGVQVTAGENYVHAARLPLDLQTLTRPALIAVHVARVEGAFGLGLAGADQALVVEARVDPAPIPLEVQLSWDGEAPPVLVVRRLDALGATHPRILIGAITLAFPCAALVPGGDKPEAQAVLSAMGEAPRTILSPALTAPPEGDGRSALDQPVEIEVGDAPWTYVFSMPLPPEAAHAMLRVDLGPGSFPVFVLRVDEAWAAVGERVEAPAAARPRTVWLERPAERIAARLVLQAGAAPASGRVTLGGVFLYPAD